jgi:transcriptional regulator GlxA family with amidase domain
MEKGMNLRRRWAALALSLMATAATSANAAPSTIGILVFDGFLTSDVTAPVEVFGAASKKAGLSYKVLVVAATKQTVVRSEEGLTVVADKTIYDDLKLDVLLVPSSYKMDGILKNKDLIDFIKKQSRSASWMASNCSGAQLLGEAGLLDGKQATTWAGGEKTLAAAYPKIKVQVDKNVVVDDKVITSNGGAVSYQAALELLTRLSSVTFATEVAAQIQFPRLRSAFK